ncbi:hypothetical protein D3C87_35370 [compost metagenome]
MINMKFLLKSIVLSILFLSACSGSKKEIKNAECDSSAESTLNPVFDQIMDSFLVELTKYDQVNKKTNDTIKLIAYVRLEESSQNQAFKVHLEGIVSDSLLYTTTINKVFIRNGRYVCFDYNNSNLINQEVRGLKDSIISNSGILKYTRPVRGIPSWLVLIENQQITKLNKRANSCFSNVKDYKAVEKTSELEFYPIDEWGDVYDKKGNKIDSLK